MTPHDDYKPLDVPQGLTVAACPVCGSPGALWQYSTSETTPTTKAVMNSEDGEAA